jgi:hypothetical protein
MITVQKYNEIEKEDSLGVITAKLNAIGSSQADTFSAFELDAFIKKVEEIITPAKLRMWICAGIGKESRVFKSIEDVLDNDAHPIYSFKMEAYTNE